MRSRAPTQKPNPDVCGSRSTAAFMQILADKVIILTDAALRPEDVNVEEARADLRRAEETLAQKRGTDDRADRRALAWAQARLDVTQRPA